VKRLIDFRWKGGAPAEWKWTSHRRHPVRDFGSLEPEVAAQTFETSLDKVKPAAGRIIARLRQFADPLDLVVVEFRLKFGRKAGAIIVSASTEANFLVS
jgi:hypothetical protein